MNAPSEDLLNPSKDLLYPREDLVFLREEGASPTQEMEYVSQYGYINSEYLGFWCWDGNGNDGKLLF